VKSQIVGTSMPALEIFLESGEGVIAVSGELSWMTESIILSTVIQHGGGGLFGAIKRIAGGGSIFMTQYKAEGAQGMVAFAAKVPGHIIPVTVSATETYLVHRSGFLCGTPQIELTVGFQQSLGAGIFGGDGFILQKLAGQGEAWIEVGGEIVTYDLVPGQTLRVHPGHVAMFQSSVGFKIVTIRGISNALFGGDGLFFASLTGPGRVWLQTLTVPNLAHSIAPYLPKEQK